MAAGANRRVCGVARLPRASPSAHLAGTTEEGRRTSWTTGPRTSIRTHGSVATSRRSSCGTSRSNARGSAGGWRPRAAATASGARARRSPSAPRCSPRRSCPRSRAARAAGARRGRPGRAAVPTPPVDTSSLAAATGGGTQLLRFGDVGPAVTAIQRQVGVTADGIFGPITRGAVERFQRDHGLGMTGIVDARTWAALFNGRVLFYDAPGSRGGCRPPGGGGAAGLGAPGGGPQRIGGAGVAGRDGRRVVGRGRRRLVSRVVGVVRLVGVRGLRVGRVGVGLGRVRSAVERARAVEARHAGTEADDARAHRAGADHVGRRLHLGADRLAGERRDADRPLRRVPPRAPPRRRRPRRRERHADPRRAVRHGRAVRRPSRATA